VTQHDTAKLEQRFNGYKRCNAESLSRVLLNAVTPRGTKPTFAFNESFPVDLGLKKLGVISHKLTIKEPAQ